MDPIPINRVQPYAMIRDKLKLLQRDVQHSLAEGRRDVALFIIDDARRTLSPTYPQLHLQLALFSEDVKSHPYPAGSSSPVILYGRSMHPKPSFAHQKSDEMAGPQELL